MNKSLQDWVLSGITLMTKNYNFLEGLVLVAIMSHKHCFNLKGVTP